MVHLILFTTCGTHMWKGAAPILIMILTIKIIE